MSDKLVTDTRTGFTGRVTGSCVIDGVMNAAISSVIKQGGDYGDTKWVPVEFIRLVATETEATHNSAVRSFARKDGTAFQVSLIDTDWTEWDAMKHIDEADEIEFLMQSMGVPLGDMALADGTGEP